MMCKKNEECRWKISSYQEEKWENWNAKSYEKIERMLFRWGIIVRIISSNESEWILKELIYLSNLDDIKSDAFADDEIFVWWRIDSSEELISLAVDDA